MIRLAFLGVFLLAGLLAFGAFFLARGSVNDDVVAIEASVPPVVETPQEEDVDTRLYFLRDLDLLAGPLTVVLRDAITGNGDMVVRDKTAILTAKPTAYINTAPTGGEVAGLVVLAMMGVPPENTVIEIFRGDTLIAAVQCASTTCGDFASDMDIDLGPLLTAAQPLIREQSFADNYDDYLTDLSAINQSPDYMFLDLRPENAAPQTRQIARMELYLPTLVTPAGDTVDANVLSALARSVVDPVLPDGASINGVTFSSSGQGIVADMDSGTPSLAGGAEILFPDVEFTNIRISIEGASALSDAALQTLTDQPLAQTDYTDSFAAFVRDRLQSSCEDCFRVKMRGDHYDAATVTLSEPEGYRLDYYDLRDPP